MAKRRKVSNMLALAVLSTVTMRPMHPYEMASKLREFGKDQDIKFKWGSLYTVVQNLEKHGFLEVVASGRQGGRPERTVYRITHAGREELADWVRELMAVPEPEFPRFKAALSVAGVIGPDEMIDLLRQRAAALEEQIAQMRAGLAAASAVPRLFLIEGEFDLAMREAELTWVRSLLEELTGGTLPGIEAWRTYHRTGKLPPEFIVEGSTGTGTGTGTDTDT
jgi:DNA-binding PadR family transcriptional regulator